MNYDELKQLEKPPNRRALRFQPLSREVNYTFMHIMSLSNFSSPILSRLDKPSFKRKDKFSYTPHFISFVLLKLGSMEGVRCEHHNK